MDYSFKAFAGRFCEGREKIFNHCNFDSCNACRVDFQKSVFKYCNFANANLEGANFKDCRFEFCNFHEANLDNANLENIVFNHCIGNGKEIKSVNVSPFSTITWTKDFIHLGCWERVSLGEIESLRERVKAYKGISEVERKYTLFFMDLIKELENGN